MNETDLEGATARISVAHYSAEEVVQRFFSLYNCIDFKEKLEELEIGTFQFVRRKKAMQELKALSIALWNLALQKSFPSNADDFFQVFCRELPDLADGGKKAQQMQGRIENYLDLLNEKKDADFLPVASYLSEVLALNAEDMHRLRVRLSLMTRKLFKHVFDHLV